MTEIAGLSDIHTADAFNRAVSQETLDVLDVWPVYFSRGRVICADCEGDGLIANLQDPHGVTLTLPAYDHVRAMTLLHMVRHHRVRMDGRRPELAEGAPCAETS